MPPPIKYKPEFCEQIIAHMSAGRSFESFGGVIGVGRDTLYQWKKKRRVFSDAIEVGASKSRLYWESIGQAAMMGTDLVQVNDDGTRERVSTKRFNTHMYSLQVRNRFPNEWSERTNLALVDKDNQPQNFTDWVETVSKKAQKKK